ncbi:predicted protein [Nematostella vectensis]|uniref:Dipeptidyl peptidase 9 n=1 Tax=Nematostella vectensis TaxID=45351 RepID=A7RPQ4_NEMVE|nr:predicted protein [Nematostella vectensis]|eukprot:XP_001638675.1 predicted protein [Nematostella vectensis]
MYNAWTSPENEQFPGGTQKRTKERRSWKDLQFAVKVTRGLQQNLVNRIPHSFTFSRDRLYFLAVPTNSRENTIQYVDLPRPLERTCVEYPQLEWQPLLDTFKPLPFAGFSKEEQLLRERKRLGAFGITSYDFNDSSRRFLFPVSNSLYTFVDWHNNEMPVMPDEIPSQVHEAKLDAKICPCDANIVAFIHRNDIWIVNISTGEEKRLTNTNGGSANAMDEPLSAGVASFIAQEEFDRYTGYWWQPKLTVDETNRTRIYRILYEEVDESPVEVLHIISSPEGALQGSSVDSYRYPKAGSSNAISKIKIVEFSIEESGSISGNVTEYNLLVPFDETFPTMEYIVRAGWVSTGDSAWVQLLSRNQQHLTMVLLPLTCFSAVVPSDFSLISLPQQMPIMQVLAEDTSDIWINVSDIIYFLKPGSDTQFIWSSEASGHRHLYLASVRSNHVISRGRSRSLIGQNAVYYPLVTQRQLTEGDWEVDTKTIWVDEERRLIYFIGTKDTPLEHHLYVVSYDDNSTTEVQRLTELGFSHSVSMNENFTRFITVSSSVNETHRAMVYDISHDQVVLNHVPMITVEPVACLMQPETLGSDYKAPEIFSYKSKQGYQVYGLIFKPHNVEPGVKYPTILYVYGGPQVQLVTNSHKGVRFLRLHTLAMLGYVVVVIDGRGSAQRGLHFEGHIKNRMGQVEIEDQVEGLQYIASTTEMIDLSRVAIHGWSYGGYLSLLGLIQRPDVFRIAIAGAPVTAWEAYDTGYTERYMGTPQDNSRAYTMSSVLTYVNNFPDEENRLLLVHGLIDENVHFYHTSLLINELVKACKPYQLLVYPNERHGIRQTVASEHYETTMLSFLQQNL